MHVLRRWIPKISIFAMMGLGALLCSFSVAWGDDAAVLPKGTFQFLSDNRFFLEVTERYDKDGNKEPWATDFNTVINQNVFPALSAFSGAPFSIPAPTVGLTNTSMKWNFVQSLYQLAYGLTDQITLGVRIPWIWAQNKVKFSFDSSGADVNIGINPAFINPGTNPLGFAPLVVPGTTRVDTVAAQNALKTLGFKQLKDFERSGIQDIELGARYQYYKSEYLRLAVTGGARFPTGRKDDPENLADWGLGDGAYALLIRLNQDFVVQPDSPLKSLGFPVPGSFFLNTSFRYDYFVPDKERLRVTSINDPLGGEFDYVNRKIGDIFQAEITPKLGIWKGFTLFGTYRFAHKFKDDYSGDKNLPYGDLAIGTNYDEHVYIVGLSFTTLPWVVEKTFPVPLVVSVSYRDRFAADNFLNVSEYIGLSLAAYF